MDIEIFVADINTPLLQVFGRMELGLCEELLGRAQSAQSKRKLRIYGCRHCPPVEVAAERPAKSMALPEVQQCQVEAGKEERVAGEIADHAVSSSREVEPEVQKSNPVKKFGTGRRAKLMDFDGLRSHLNAA